MALVSKGRSSGIGEAAYSCSITSRVFELRYSNCVNVIDFSFRYKMMMKFQFLK